MKFAELYNIAEAQMKATNPGFQGFSEDTARAMAAAWTVNALIQCQGKITLDDLAFIDKNANAVCLPLPKTGKQQQDNINAKTKSDKLSGEATE